MGGTLDADQGQSRSGQLASERAGGEEKLQTIFVHCCIHCAMNSGWHPAEARGMFCLNG